MKRDIELMRKILFTIEEQYDPGDGYIWGLKIEGYEMSIIAEHCDLLHQQDLIKTYKASYASDGIIGFSVGNLTATGYDYLELIRNNEVWENTKTEIEQRNLPKTIEQIAQVAGVFWGKFMQNFTG